MRKLLFFILVSAFFASGCKDKMTGSITGQIYTFSKYGFGYDYPDGITVEIPGTDFKTYTTNGIYEFKDIPPGVYDLHIYGGDFTEYKIFDIPVVGGDKPVVLEKTFIDHKPTGTIKKIYEPEKEYKKLVYKVLCEDCQQISIFLSDKPELDFSSFNFVLYLGYTTDPDTFYFSVFQSDFDDFNSNLDKLYVTVYNSSKYFVYYYDPEKKTYCFPYLADHLPTFEIKKSDFEK